jgi:outer membrane protein
MERVSQDHTMNLIAPPAPSGLVPTLAAVLVLGLTGAIALAGGLAAQEPLTLREAVDRALAYHPEIRTAAGDEAVAEWDVRSARGSLFPFATASSGVSWQGGGEQRFGSLTAGQLGFGDQPSFLFSSYNLGLSYTLSGSVLRAPARARASHSAAEARTRDAEAAVALEVTRAYLELQRASRTVGLVALELERARANLRLAEGQERVGSATVLDVNQAEVQEGRAEVALLRAEQVARGSRLALLRLVGMELDREVEAVTELPVAPVEWTEGELYRTAVELNPELASLRARAEAAGIEARMARSAYYPSLSVQAGVSGFTRRASQSDFLLAQVEQQERQLVGQCEFQNDIFRRLAEPLPTQDCDELLLTDQQRQAALDQNRQFPFGFVRQPAQLSLTVSVPIFQGLDRQRQLEAARIQRDDARYRIRDREQALRAEVARLLDTARTAFRAVELETRNRELAERQLGLARTRFELGDSDFLDLAEAEALRAQADRDYLDAVFEYHETLARIAALSGRALPD